MNQNQRSYTYNNCNLQKNSYSKIRIVTVEISVRDEYDLIVQNPRTS